MSDDQIIIVPVNRPDDCSTEQPPKCDAVAACPVQPPKDEDAAACPVQSPNDDAASPVPLPNDQAKMMYVAMSSNDDDAAGPVPPPKDDADLAPPPNNNAAKMSSQDDDAVPAPPPKEDAVPAPPSMDVGTVHPADVTVPLTRKRQKLRNQPGSSRANRSAATADSYARVDIKKEIKHETIDLGNDTYFYDENNKPILIRGPPKVGFDRGLEPDHIVGATEEDGKLMFLIAWKNSEVADLLECTEVYDRAPQIAIQFFQSRLKYCCPVPITNSD